MQVPTQLLISGADFVVHRRPQEQFFERLGSLHKEKHILPGFFHDTLGEQRRGIAVASARRFIVQNFQQPLERPSLFAADRLGRSTLPTVSQAAGDVSRAARSMRKPHTRKITIATA